VPDHLAFAADRPALHSVEETGQGEEVLLRPFLERVMVALAHSSRNPRNAWLSALVASAGVGKAR